MKPGTQGRNVKAGTKAEDNEKCRLLSVTCSATFLMYPRLTRLGMAPPMVGWALIHQLGVTKTSHRQVQEPI